jgi:hypothetical protein
MIALALPWLFGAALAASAVVAAPASVVGAATAELLLPTCTVSAGARRPCHFAHAASE